MSFVTQTGPSKPITRSGCIGEARKVGMTDEQAEANYQRMIRLEWWGNLLYTVSVDRDSDLNFFPPESGIKVTHISIHRRDRAPCTDWRDFQRIKDDVVGPDVEACQLHPAAERVVDTANEYHLWALIGPPGTAFPFGWPSGLQTDKPVANGSVQRKLGETS